eukprot:1777688-Pyramimonas_sp.AAC.1
MDEAFSFCQRCCPALIGAYFAGFSALLQVGRQVTSKASLGPVKKTMEILQEEMERPVRDTGHIDTR